MNRHAKHLGAGAQAFVRLDDENARGRDAAGFYPACQHGVTHIAAAGEDEVDRHRKNSHCCRRE
jgi:hypothetical protein